MDLPQLISNSKLAAKTESEFFATLALSLLNKQVLFNILHSKNEKQKKLADIQQNESRKYHFVKSKKEEWEKHLKELINIQKKILSCLNTNEFILFLACIKGLEEQGCEIGYNETFQEILENHLHKMILSSHSNPLIGRKKEQEDIARILHRTFRNNILITGAIGVGKTTLARSIAKEQETFQVIELFPKNPHFMRQVAMILSNIKKDKKLLFLLDELFLFDISQIQYLLEKTQIIATASDASWKKLVADYPVIESKFDIIHLKEPSKSDTIAILQAQKNHIVSIYNISCTEKVIHEVYELGKKYLLDSVFPIKGITLLEESAYLAKQKGRNEIIADDIKEIISNKTGIPINSLTDFEKKNLENLFEKLQKRIKGQDNAIEKVVETIQRARLGLSRPNKPIGSFLFVGSSGVGKTELAKAIASEIFGDEEFIIRFDMSEFSESHTVHRLIGAPPGYVGFEEGGQLTNAVRQKPYSLILLDEIEKAHSRIFDIFLQVLDDGRLTDGQGKKVDFRHTIIVATSNAGIDDILDMLEEGRSLESIEQEVKEILSDYFRIEFLNRFDHIVMFRPLTKESLKAIAKIHLNKISEELLKRHIAVSFSEETIELLSSYSIDARFGARELIRLIQNSIESKLANMIIKNEIIPGQKVVF